MEIVGEIITSSQNKFVSLTRGLANKKSRESEKMFRFDGVKLLCEAIERGVKPEFLLVCENEMDAVLAKAEKLYGIKENDINCRAMTVARNLFERLSEEMAPEGVICVANYMEELHCSISCENAGGEDLDEQILLLESVRDPQNVGAIIRVAAAFGVNRVIMSRDCADIYNAKAIRASMGTLFGMRINRVDDFALSVRYLKANGRRVFAAALERDAAKLGEFSLKKGDCVVIGNEGHGLSKETLEACTGCVFIPMSEQVESLNAATAAAILVWEFFGSGKRGLHNE